ncbi:hypothetical protein GKE82_08335 [Conexibacter sp. W3-3-2]|uniref:glycosyltransferase family 39 protein n=1 Tax=Conexibacter sp. W3-3-2 TaxID=2675227 RepID=UPI0012B92F5F|nr:glycosyltransferase family 39 protein [Conexibacter sp. W3-3-2]MTD44304.1 hypothetical protein [Conexibacter sp. W3-3-2]
MSARAARAAPALASAALLALAAWAWIRYPVAPTYDSLASLVWGRDVLAGRMPAFDGFHAPTEHPLWLALSVLLAPLGEQAGRGMTLVTVLALVALAVGTYRLGARVFGPAAGVVAAALLLTRLNFGFYAAFGFLDVPFVALVIWAAALEAERPRRGRIVWVLLVAAGLLRPEAWVMAGAYALWLGGPPAAIVRRGVLVALAPVLWALTDLVVTGNPLFSFTYTTDAASDLGRTRGLLHLPESVYGALREVLKPPVLAAGIAGLVLALRRGSPSRTDLVLLGTGALGLLTFCALVVGGVSAQVPRYAAVLAVVLLVYAGHLVATGGRLVLAARRGVALAAVAVLATAGGLLATRLHPASAASELRFRVAVERDLAAALRTPAVRRARACGPIAVPTHKLLPVTRWLVGGREDRVIARSDLDERRRPGVVLLPQGFRLLHNAAYGSFTAGVGAPAAVTQRVPSELRFRGRSPGRRFAIYTRC